MGKNTQVRTALKPALLALVPLAFLAIFFYQPLLAILRLVFSAPFQAQSQPFSLTQVARPLGFTVWQALLSTLLTLVLGLPAAYVFSHYDFWGRKTLRLATLLPFILPTVVVAASFNALLGPRGWFNLALMAVFGLAEPPLQVLNSLPAILLAHVFYNTSIVIRIVGGAWSRLDERLEQVARTLGANPWQVLKEVTAPLLSPALIGAALLVFLFDFTSFGVVLMLGGPRYATLEVEIYTQAMHMLNLPLAGLLSVVQMGFTLLITLLQSRVSLPRYGRAALRSERANLRKPVLARQRLLVAAVSILLAVIIALPILSLTARSFVTLEAARGERGTVETGLTTRYYREIFVNRTGSLFYVPPIEAMRNSLIYSGLTVLIATTLGLLAAYAFSHPSRLGRWLEPLFMLPLGASAVTLGLGFVVVFNRPPWTGMAFPLLIPIAHSLVALPLVIRTLLPALRGIPTGLRQAASMLGASPVQRFVHIDLPIMLRAILVSMVFAFTISLGEFGASSFLSTARTPTIPVAIYRYISQPGALNYGQALAMSTLLLAVCAAGSLLIEKIRLPGEELF